MRKVLQLRIKKIVSFGFRFFVSVTL